MERTGGLLRWQYSLYPDGHHDRLNLILHILSVPLFWAGTAAIAMSWTWPWLALIGFGGMVAAIAAQGRGHSRETTRPVPFNGPLDFVSRFFVEQWVTFPRYLMSGGFARAWRSEASHDRK